MSVTRGVLVRFGPIGALLLLYIEEFGIPCRTFVFGVTVSTAVWAGFWLWVGAHFGARIGHFLGGHRWAYLVVAVVILALIAAAITRMVRAEEPAPADE